jgi:hypothetical protein
MSIVPFLSNTFAMLPTPCLESGLDALNPPMFVTRRLSSGVVVCEGAVGCKAVLVVDELPPFGLRLFRSRLLGLGRVGVGCALMMELIFEDVLYEIEE